MGEIVKHTPGPWVLETVDTSCGKCHKIGPFPRVAGKDSHACVYVDNSQWSVAGELTANARLIAAAPELLELAELVFGIVCESQGIAGYHLNGDVADWGEFEGIVALQDTLKKVRGE